MDLTLSAESYFRSIKRINVYRELFEYLLLHKQLNLPGIGTFSAERKPADIDFASKQVIAPSYSFTLHKDYNSTPSKRLFSWLASTLNISELDSVIRFNNFVFDLRDKLAAGNKLEWKHLGVLSKGLSGEIIFEPGEITEIESPVPAVKVLREKADHTVMVGEYERTSEEMRDALSHVKEKRSYWKVAALVIAVIAIAFIGYYFSTHGMNTSSAGNQHQIAPGGQ